MAAKDSLGLRLKQRNRKISQLAEYRRDPNQDRAGVLFGC
jgi:hypothetical protein